MRIVSLTAVTFRADRLLLRINPFAIRVLRADDDRARRAQHGEAIALVTRVHAELEDIVAHDLWIVAGEIARGRAFKFVRRHALVRAHRQMTAETTCRPGRMAYLAADVRIVMRQITRTFFRFRNRAPIFSVTPERFCVGGLCVVVLGCRINGVNGLRHFPDQIRCHGRALEQFISLPEKARAIRRVVRAQIHVGDVCAGPNAAVAAGDERRTLLNRAVAVNALDGRRGARFAVEQAVAVDIHIEMAVGALHAVA